MSSARLCVCARRIPATPSRHLRPLISPAFSSPTHNVSPRGRPHRAYATLRNKQPRGFYDVWGNIPPVHPPLWKNWLRATRALDSGEKTRLWLRFTDEEYFKVLDTFHRVAPKYGADWASRLPQNEIPKLELLNDLGCVAARNSPQTINTKDSISVSTIVQWAMFSGAAHLGCEISALSLTRWIALASYSDKDLSKRPLFRPTMDIHRRLLEQGHRMALYVEGELLLRTGRTDAAIRILERAHAESNSTSIWWPEICDTLAVAHSMKDNRQIALRYWGQAAQEGSVDALQGIYQTTDNVDVRDGVMFKLACKGRTDVLETIAMVENAKLEDEDYANSQDPAFQEKWAGQWTKMANYDRRGKIALAREAFKNSVPPTTEDGEPLPEEALQAEPAEVQNGTQEEENPFRSRAGR